MPDAWFEIHGEADDRKRVELPSGRPEIVVGRSPECDVVIAASSVSRRHVRLRQTDDGVLLEDLGSANGTRINGKAVTEPVLLGHQDRITFGSVQTTFMSPPAPPPTPPPAAADEDATVAAPPPVPETRFVAPPPREETASPAPGPVIAPQPAPAAPRAPTRAIEPTAPMPAPTPAPTLSPGMLELVAIGAGSFAAVLLLGWLVLSFL